jgi:hypothetical protein
MLGEIAQTLMLWATLSDNWGLSPQGAPQSIELFAISL